MVRQIDAQNISDTALRKYKLWEQGWRTNFTKVTNYIALCDHTNKRIIISIPHLNARSEAELTDTVLHEVAHALVGPGHGHDEVWQAKAIEIGARPVHCAPSNIEAGRALNVVETKPEKKIKALNNYCPVCYAVAVTKSQLTKKDIITGFPKILLTLECGHTIEKDMIKSALADIANWTSATGKKIFPYQVDGIKFIAEANGRCLIADEPGLGKTSQALGALKFFPEMRPALWVSKATLKLQTIKEAIDWGGAELMGQIIEHKKMFIIPNLNLYIVSMDLLRNIPTEKLEEIPFKTVVADEIQHFKDNDSIRTNELRKLVAKAEYFLPLSGTPWKNRGSEYFPVLNMLKPDMFTTPKSFQHNWIDYYLDKQTGKWREGGIKNIPAFREKTKGFIIRRMRDDVLPDLPKINRKIRFVDMDEMYKKSYDKNEEKVAALIKAAMIDGRPMKDIASMIMALKHITGLAKVRALIDDAQEWLENVPEEFEKLSIFHHHIDVGDNIQKGNGNEYEGLDTWLSANGYNKSLRLYGGKSAEERDYIINSFKNDPRNRVLIGSTLASGEGLNIQFCQHAFMLERQWNPQNEEQAELRFSRPLTKNDLPEYLHHIVERKISIDIPYFIAAGTVDEILTNIIERKRLNFRRSMNEKDINLTWDENEIIREVSEEIIRRRYKKTA